MRSGHHESRHYTVLGLIGRGGQGNVYHARLEGLQAQGAVLVTLGAHRLRHPVLGAQLLGDSRQRPNRLGGRRSAIEPGGH